MNLPFLDRLPPPHEWPLWLEEQLMGTELGDLVVELTALGEVTGRREQNAVSPELSDVLGPHLTETLDHGLADVELERLEELLRHPQLLLDLQERVLTEGGDYWQRVPASRNHKDQIEQQWIQLERLLSLADNPLESHTSTGSTSATLELPWDTEPEWNAEVDGKPPVTSEPAGPVAPTTPISAPAVEKIPRRRSGAAAWLGVLITAVACVTLMLWQPWQPVPSPWGFNNPAALSQTGTPQEYWQQLADAGQQWFKKRPETAEALKTRLESFRNGCDALLLAPHTPLAEADRLALNDACRTCRNELQSHLDRLSEGADVNEVLQGADNSVNRLIAVLREKVTAAA